MGVLLRTSAMTALRTAGVEEALHLPVPHLQYSELELSQNFQELFENAQRNASDNSEAPSIGACSWRVVIRYMYVRQRSNLL